MVAWGGFALVMWATHFSPMYQAALADPGLHALEHLAYLGSAMLFWSAVAAVDPSPARLSPPARLMINHISERLGAFADFLAAPPRRPKRRGRA